jgi:hypothetical protein
MWIYIHSANTPAFPSAWLVKHRDNFKMSSLVLRKVSVHSFQPLPNDLRASFHKRIFEFIQNRIAITYFWLKDLNIFVKPQSFHVYQRVLFTLGKEDLLDFSNMDLIFHLNSVATVSRSFKTTDSTACIMCIEECGFITEKFKPCQTIVSLDSVRTYFEWLRIDFLESENGLEKTNLIIVKQGEIMNINRLLLIKYDSGLTFHSSEYNLVGRNYLEVIWESSPVVRFSGVVMPCCGNENTSCSWEVPYWHTGQFSKNVDCQREYL